MSAPLTLNTTAGHVASSSSLGSSSSLASSSALAASGPTIEPNAVGALAQGTYDELRSGGLSDVDIMAFAGELLSLVASGVRRQPSDS